MSKLNILNNLSILTKIVYRLCSKFPYDEKYNTTAQAKRAIISARLNIREGNTFKNQNRKRLFQTALGSLEEVDEVMLIALELNWVTKKDFESYREQYWHCLNMLKKLIKSISSIEKWT